MVSTRQRIVTMLRDAGMVEETDNGPVVHGRQVIGFDEVGLQSDLSSGSYVIADPKDKPSMQLASYGSTHVTVVVMHAFDGTPLPPVVVFSGKELKKQQMVGIPSGWSVMCSDTGSMKANMLRLVFEHIHQECRPVLGLAEETPLAIIIDGASVHKDEEALRYAVEHGMHVHTEVPNCTHLVQVADQLPNKKFKRNMREGVRRFPGSLRDRVRGLLRDAYSQITASDITESVTRCGWVYADEGMTYLAVD